MGMIESIKKKFPKEEDKECDDKPKVLNYMIIKKDKSKIFVKSIEVGAWGCFLRVLDDKGNFIFLINTSEIDSVFIVNENGNYVGGIIIN